MTRLPWQKLFLFSFLLLAQQPPPLPQWARASSFTRFLYHTQRRTTVSRTPLDEWSASHRDLYLTTHNTHNRQTSMPPGGIRTHNLSRRAAADLRLRPRGHWDRLAQTLTCTENKLRKNLKIDWRQIHNRHLDAFKNKPHFLQPAEHQIHWEQQRQHKVRRFLNWCVKCEKNSDGDRKHKVRQQLFLLWNVICSVIER